MFYFSGASKNNLGLAGIGGSVHDPGGRKVFHYAFRLGNVSNILKNHIHYGMVSSFPRKKESEP